MSISDAAFEKLEGFSKRLDDVREQRDDASNSLRFEYRQKMEPLFTERASALASVDNFWSGVIASPETPLSSLMNNTIDPKISRALTAVKVTYKLNGTKLQRKVEVTLRSNMFAEEGTVSREVDSEGKTISVQSIKWKAGTDRARTDSLFRYFDEKAEIDELLVSDITDAFDIIYQDPFLADVN